MSLESYSKNLQKILKNTDIGDLIEVKTNDSEYHGILMPRTPGDSSCLVLKLNNGYNIGISEKKIEKITRKKKKSGVKSMKIKFNKSKPPISMITTGGTITSKIDYTTGGVSSLIKPEELLETVPDLKDIVNVKEIVSPFTKMSEDMNTDDWEKIAEETYKLLKKDNQGVIITHGTDTLHYTAAALSFALRNLNKPVVLVGAQRSSDRGSSDNTMNMICSSIVALSDIAEVGICMHGTINDDYCLFINGTRARKMHSSRRDAFRPINSKPIAKINSNGLIEQIKDYKKRNENTPILENKFEKKIALIKIYPGSDPSVLDHYLSKKYKGFVLEGTGLGHVPSEWIKKIEKVAKKVPVVVTSQTIYGRTNPNVYSNLRKLYHEAGAICVEDMTTETAFVKLSWIIGNKKDLSLMKENIAGEISERSEISDFLY